MNTLIQQPDKVNGLVTQANSSSSVAPNQPTTTVQATAVQASAPLATVQVPIWKKEMWSVLDKLFLRKECEIFREPVPWKELQLFDYLDIIGNKPMDLGTLSKNLASGQYKSVNDCTSDMRLIWTNALVYNAQGSKIYQQAKVMSELWEGLWAITESGKADPMKPPSTAEQVRFAESCHQLSSKDLGLLLMALDEVRSQCLMKDPINKTVEVNLDLIDGTAYKRGIALISDLLSKPRKDASGGGGGHAAAAAAAVAAVAGSGNTGMRVGNVNAGVVTSEGNGNAVSFPKKRSVEYISSDFPNKR